MKKGYIDNIEKVTVKNSDYRRAIYTGKHSQLVVMSLKPGEEISNEVHELDQFIRIEQGKAKVSLNNGDREQEIEDDWAIIVPAGCWHNIINIGENDLKLYTIYSPPEHQKDVLQPTKADEKEEHFDGQTTE